MEISFLPWPASHCPPSHSLVHSWVILQVLGCDKWLVFGSSFVCSFQTPTQTVAQVTLAPASGKLKTSFKGCAGMRQVLLETPRMEQNG